MLLDQQITANSNCDDWAIQSEFWIAETAKLQKPRRIRQRNSNPLILTGHGTSMRIDCGTLLIKEGFTHYPQKQIEHRYFAADLELPRTILLLDGSGSLSFDVLSWLGEQGVSLIRIKWDGSIAVAVNAMRNPFKSRNANGFCERSNQPEIAKFHCNFAQSFCRFAYPTKGN